MKLRKPLLLQGLHNIQEPPELQNVKAIRTKALADMQEAPEAPEAPVPPKPQRTGKEQAFVAPRRLQSKKTKYFMGKLRKYRYMMAFKSVRSYLPDTRLATKTNINAMLRSYSSVYVKPDTGSGGHGIYKITKTGHRFVVKSGTVVRRYASFDEMYKTIHPLLRQQVYVVQKTIPMLRHQKRPFDIRVMVQKNRQNQLVATGIIGRLARRGKIVTNYHSGGTPLPVSVLLRSHMNKADAGRYVKRLEAIGIKGSFALGKAYRKLRAFGVDIAIDLKKKPWILEINTKPDKKIFKTLKDKTMYRRIWKYARF